MFACVWQTWDLARRENLSSMGSRSCDRGWRCLRRLQCAQRVARCAPDHADGLPSRLAGDLAILRGDVAGIVEHVQCGVEADTVLLPVEPILSRVPGEVHGDSRIYDVVYTLVNCVEAGVQEGI